MKEYSKYLIDFEVVANSHVGARLSALYLRPVNGTELPKMGPGQFVQIDIPSSKSTFLRRPISVNFADYETNTLTLLVQDAGAGTHALCEAKTGDIFNILLPLGNTFPVETLDGKRVLLIGGGVGIAPLLYYASVLSSRGQCAEVSALLGARSADGLTSLSDFERYCMIGCCTEDGSAGTKGFVTAHSALDGGYDVWCVCGPALMMKAVAKIARKKGVRCYVSLENMMACGLGACLCCVEKTVKGNVCVCKEGPVFGIDQLTWE